MMSPAPVGRGVYGYAKHVMCGCGLPLKLQGGGQRFGSLQDFAVNLV